jgi:hypothetical protein
MSALLPILLCGGGCLIMCVVMMGRMHRGSDASPQDRSGAGRRHTKESDGWRD